LIAGLPGILFALAMMLVREPPRSQGMAITDSAGATLREVFDFVKSEARLLVPVFLGLPVLAAAQFGMNVWAPSFFIRTYDWTASEIGSVFGLMVTILSTAGVVTGGWMADRQLARGRREANLQVSMWAALTALPFAAAFPLAGDATLSLVLLAPVLFFGAMPFGAGPAAIPILAPNRMRAQLMAVYLLFGNLLGAGLGPWMIAAFTDFVVGDPAGIRWSLAIVGPLAILAGATIVGMGARAMRAEDKRNAA
jgi:hypothetical protein